MKLKKIIRLDSIPLSPTYYTSEGYLVDHPIVTTCGIFEYRNNDGSIRRELRLPEEVFKQDSLDSYKGKPIIITHDAGEISKDNVADEEIGTILSKGYKDGDNVRAEIVIHDTDRMKKYGLKELSLGYNLTLDETAGEWNGQHYDAIQRNIEINHLALVREARAGENARLNIDGKEEDKQMFDQNKPTGGMPMGNPMNVAQEEKKPFGEQQNDGCCQRDEDNKPDALTQAVENIKKQQGEDAPAQEAPMQAPAQGMPEKEDEMEAPVEEQKPAPEDVINNVKERRDRRDEAGDPQTEEQAMTTIAQQDEDIEALLTALEELLAKFGHGNKDGVDVQKEVLSNWHENDSANCNGKAMNMDSVDRIVSEKLAICRVGDKLGIRNIEGKSIRDAKKAVIAKVNPNVRLDGKDAAYIDAMYDISCQTVNDRRTTDAQRAQMFNVDSKQPEVYSADTARRKMIERINGGK